ncbi:MAG: methyl-accepting chemotaxis protein [Proteobacteria bacterium]|nr:methyl-accepting chemotaxis protein [Pseudomonadota bacterium]
MAEDTNTTNILRSPVLLSMIGLLVLLIAGFSLNLYMLSDSSDESNPYVQHASEMQVIAQGIAKHASAAGGGNASAFASLARDKDEFDRQLSVLRNGDGATGLPAAPSSAQASVSQVEGLWADLSNRIDTMIQKKGAVDAQRESSADITINLQLIQQENNKVVRALAGNNAASNEIITAQRQALLIERIGHTVDKVIDRGFEQALQDQYSRDSSTFSAVLRGFQNGDTGLVITAISDAEVRANLERVDALFKSVDNSIKDVLSKADEVAELRNAAAAIYESSANFVPAIGALTISLESLGGGAGLASMEIAFVLLGIILVVFVIITALIYRASNSSVNESTQQNEDNQAAILQLLDELADLADGDLRVQATVTESFTGAIADSINFSIDQMRELVSKINETSARVSNAADQTQSSVSALSEASQRQADEIADVSEAVNEMAVSIDMVSYNAAESSSVAERSVDIASKGAVVVQNTIDGMDNIRGQIQETAKRIKRLGESSQEIGDIVSLINDIADQTNILSLNAAIQASMAGDAGKGFAVVADEVQRLAERSGAAAKQISALVKTIQSDTNEAVSSMEQTTAEVVQGTRLAQDAGVALGEIESVSKSLAEIIENISDAARQQAASAGKISNTMNSIQEITTATTDGTKKTATAVGNLAEMANELRSSVTFKLPE